VPIALAGWPKRSGIADPGVDPQSRLAREARGWWAAAVAGGTMLAVLARIGMRWDVSRQHDLLRSDLEEYHASLYTVIDWLAGGKARIAPLVGIGACWGCHLAGVETRSRSRRLSAIGTICLHANGYSVLHVIGRCCALPNPAWLLTVLQFLPTTC